MTEEPETYQRMLQSLIFKAQQVGLTLVAGLNTMLKRRQAYFHYSLVNKHIN